MRGRQTRTDIQMDKKTERLTDRMIDIKRGTDRAEQTESNRDTDCQREREREIDTHTHTQIRTYIRETETGHSINPLPDDRF